MVIDRNESVFHAYAFIDKHEIEKNNMARHVDTGNVDRSTTSP